MWQSWTERQLAMNSLASMRISKAQLIYNIDHNMKSSRVPEPELIKVQWEERKQRLFCLQT